MKHMVTWAEISVSDMERAMAFYQKILAVDFKRESMGDLDYAMFACEQEAISGALVAGESYEPSDKGSIIYLNGGDDLNVSLDKISAQGKQIVIPKTPINDGECGYFAQFIDSEGNRVGLYSSN